MRRRRQALQVSTFPFLAVLLCAMGSLILLLLVIDRRAKAVARLKAEQAISRKNEEDDRAAASRKAEWERRRQALHNLLHDEDQKLIEQIHSEDARARINDAGIRALDAAYRSLKSKLDEERARLGKDQADIAARRTAVGKNAGKKEEASKEMMRLTEELSRLEQTVIDLKLLHKRDKQTYSLVPYGGKRGDNRKPIYIECAAGRLVFHPAGVVLEGRRVKPSDVVAEVQRQIARQRQEQGTVATKKDEPPYLLMLVRPNGITTYFRALTVLQGLRFDYGYEFVDRDWVLDFSEDGEKQRPDWMIADRPPLPKAHAGAKPPPNQPRGMPRPNIRGILAERTAGPGGESGPANTVPGISISRPYPIAGMLPGPAGAGSTSASAQGPGPATGRGTSTAGGVAGGTGIGGAGTGATSGSAQGFTAATGHGTSTIAGFAGGPGTGGVGTGLPSGSAQGSTAATGRGTSMVAGFASGPGTGGVGTGLPSGWAQGSTAATGRGTSTVGGLPGGTGTGGAGTSQKDHGVLFGTGSADVDDTVPQSPATLLTGLPAGLDGDGSRRGNDSSLPTDPWHVHSGTAATMAGTDVVWPGTSANNGGQPSGAFVLIGENTPSTETAGHGVSPNSVGIGGTGSVLSDGQAGGGQVPGMVGLSSGGGSLNGTGKSGDAAGLSNISSVSTGENGGSSTTAQGSSGGRAGAGPALARSTDPRSLGVNGNTSMGTGTSVLTGEPTGPTGSAGNPSVTSDAPSQTGGSAASGSPSSRSANRQSSGTGDSPQDDGKANHPQPQGEPRESDPDSDGGFFGKDSFLVNRDLQPGQKGGGQADFPSGGGGGDGGGGPAETLASLGSGNTFTGLSSEGPAAPARPAQPLPVSLSRIIGKREWIIPVECTADGVILRTAHVRFAAATLAPDARGDHPLTRAVEQMIAKRQATVRPGDPLYRPLIQLQVHPDGVRTYYLTYPLFQRLGMRMARKDLEPEVPKK